MLSKEEFEKLIVTTSEVERKALLYVYDYETKAGRDPNPVSRRGFDIESSGRQIEVKGIGRVNGFIQMSQNNIESLQRNPNYYLYVVRKLNTENPELTILDKKQTIERAKFHMLWEIPVRERDFQTGR